MAGQLTNTTHYPIGGSNIGLAELCSGSVKPRMENKDAPAGPAAARGQRIHKYVELAWVQEYSPDRNLTKEDRDLIRVMADDERKTGVALYEALKAVCLQLGFDVARLQVEKQFAFDAPIAGGTPDIFALQLFGNMLMVDVKTGRHKVGAKDNLQLLFYLCTILRNQSPLEVSTLVNAHMVILQSEADCPVVNTDVWTIPVSELKKYDARFSDAVHAVRVNPEHRTAGEHCEDTYCTVRATCAQHIAWQNAQSGGRIEELMEGQAPTIDLSAVELAAQLKSIPGRLKFANSIKADCEALEEKAKGLMRQIPNAVPGFKLETSYGNRSFVDEKAVFAKAKEFGLKPADLKESKTLSPNQVENLCKIKKIDFKWVDTLAVKPERGQTIVPGEAKTLADIFGVV